LTPVHMDGNFHTMKHMALGRAEEVTLVLLRTLIGWHFLYEGLVKILWPAWSRAGVPLGRWSAAGYLRAAEGPFASLFRALADSPWLPSINLLMTWSLVIVGLLLILGLFTQAAGWSALALLTLFYVSWLPTRGVMEPGAEGNYLFVNKNLIEWMAVAVLLAFRTGRIAGLDLLLSREPKATPAPTAMEPAR
jgi:thiosulfate dehydrogenase (quinone) large subunit